MHDFLEDPRERPEPVAVPYTELSADALQGVVACLEKGHGEITVEEGIRRKALGCIDRMLDFVKRNPAALAQPATRQGGFVPNIGSA